MERVSRLNRWLSFLCVTVFSVTASAQTAPDPESMGGIMGSVMGTSFAFVFLGVAAALVVVAFAGFFMRGSTWDERKRHWFGSRPLASQPHRRAGDH